MTDQVTGASERHEDRGAVGSPVERPVRPASEARGYGRFTVPAWLAHEFSTDLKRVMGKCIVVKAEHLFYGDRIEYWALSEHFRHVPLGEICPEYRWHFTSEGDMWCEEVKA